MTAKLVRKPAPPGRGARGLIRLRGTRSRGVKQGERRRRTTPNMDRPQLFHFAVPESFAPERAKGVDWHGPPAASISLWSTRNNPGPRWFGQNGFRRT